MTDTTTLAPCPFCGGCAVHFHYSGSACVGCKDCIAYLGGEESDLKPDALAEAWNRRAPAPASHEALTTALAACRDAFPVPASGSAAEFEWQGAMTDPLGVPAYVRACAAPPAQEARVPLSDEGVGKRAKVGPIHTEPGGKVAMFSAQYRQQLEQRYV